MLSWKNLVVAQDYYRSKGFEEIEVPWHVRQEITNITKPSQVPSVPYGDGDLVGSAEQSFLQLIADGTLSYGRYQATTPCFRREEAYTNIHKPYFMKVELIQIGNTSKEDLNEIIEFAHDFFQKIIPVIRVELPDGSIDLTTNDENQIELGSYGIRTYNGIGSWIYATGCAEPRLSEALNTRNKNGRVKNIIPDWKSI